MPLSRRLSLRLAAVLAVALVPATTALADSHADADPAIQYRQALMESIGSNMGAISHVLKNQLDRPGAIANHAGQMADAAALIGAAFKDRVVDGPTDAKPSIWKDGAKFDQAIADYEKAARALQAAAEGGDGAAVGAAMKGLGKSCGGCHKPFRKGKEESYKNR